MKLFRTIAVVCAIGAASLVAPVLTQSTARADEIIRDDAKVLEDLIAGSTTVSYATNGDVVQPKYGVFKVYPNQQFTLHCYAQGTNSGTENITVIMAPSITGTNFDLTHTKTFSFPLVSATAPGVVCTNSDSSLWGAAAYGGIVSVQNAHGSYVRVKIIRGTATNSR